MFKKKETLLQNIAFMGIIAAINVILSTLSTFFLFAGLFIVLLLPFFSALVTIYCKWKYYPIYVLASIGVALIISLVNAQFTVFYLIPSLITGFLFGLSFHYGLNEGLSILLTSLAQTLLTFAIIPTINAIYQVDLVNQILIILKLREYKYVDYIIPSFIYLMSLIQMLFSYIILINEIKKFNPEKRFITNEKFIMTILGLILSLSVIPFAFFMPNISYLFMCISLFINICVFIDVIYSKNKSIIILCSIFEFIGFILIFVLYSVVKMPYTLLFINTANILIFIFALLYNQKREI